MCSSLWNSSLCHQHPETGGLDAHGFPWVFHWNSWYFLCGLTVQEANPAYLLELGVAYEGKGTSMWQAHLLGVCWGWICDKPEDLHDSWGLCAGKRRCAAAHKKSVCVELVPGSLRLGREGQGHLPWNRTKSSLLRDCWQFVGANAGERERQRVGWRGRPFLALVNKPIFLSLYVYKMGPSDSCLH